MESLRKDYVGNNAIGRLVLASAAIAAKANGTFILASAVANTFGFGTVTLASAVAGDFIDVNGVRYTGVDGSKAGDNTKFSVDTSDTAAGIDLADSVANDARQGTTGDISSGETTGVVTLTTDVLGIAGNLITLTSSNGTRLAVTGSGFLTGGVDADFAIVDGVKYTAVTGVKANDTEFRVGVSDSADATDLADSIDDDTRPTQSGDEVTATATTDTVTVVAVNDGTNGNSIDISSSDVGRLLTSGATLSGGVDGDIVFVNDLAYTPVTGAKANDTEYRVGVSDSADATDLADSIDDDVRVGTETATITSTASGGVVTINGVGPTAYRVALKGSDNVTASGSFLTLLSLASTIDDNQETFKRLNFMNTPFSVQATGADKDIWKVYADRIQRVTDTTSFNLLTVRTRVLWGNRDGYIKAHTASTSLTFTWLDRTKQEIDTVKTMAEVIASGSMVFLAEDY